MAMKTATKELFLTVKREKNLMEKHLLGGISLGKTEALAIYPVSYTHLTLPTIVGV